MVSHKDRSLPSIHYDRSHSRGGKDLQKAGMFFSVATSTEASVSKLKEHLSNNKRGYFSCRLSESNTSVHEDSTVIPISFYDTGTIAE